VAVQSSEPPTVAAVGARGGSGNTGGGRGRGGRGTGGGQQTAAASPAANPVDLARLQSGLCFYHWTFGEKATKCAAPCTWGN
jgi:hypothetical protein